MPTQAPDGRAAWSAQLFAEGVRRSSSAILVEGGSGLTTLAGLGERPLSSGGDAATVKALGAAVLGRKGRAAWLVQLAGGSATLANDLAIFAKAFDGAPAVLVAREGDQPAGAPAGARWAGFSSLALPDGKNGPVFLGKLRVPRPGEANPAGVTAANATGVWAVDSDGGTRLMVREGDRFDAARRIRKLALLGTVSGSSAQRRGFNNARRLIYRVILTDGSSAIVETIVP